MTLELPPLFIERIKTQTDFNSFWAEINREKITSVRVNPHKKAVLDFETPYPVPHCTTGFYLPQRPSFITDPLWHAGAYYVQEASSMLIEQALLPLLDTPNTLHILDLCAAPGGKSTHILSLLKNHHFLVANETIKSRAVLLKDNLVKWGCSNVLITQNDPNDFQRLPEFFDIILIDAPCSGEGLFRKDPDSIKEWSHEAVQLCAQRQNRIVNDVLPALKPGGYIIYCTCTYSPQENEENIQKWTTELPLEYKPTPLLNAWSHTVEHTGRGYRCWPHKVKGEGFFMACMQKNTQNSAFLAKSNHLSATKPHKADVFPNKYSHMLSKWLLDVSYFTYLIDKNQEIIAIPNPFMPQVTKIYKELTVFYGPLTVGKWLGNEVQPSHELSLSIHIGKSVSTIPFNTQQCNFFVKKEDISGIEAVKQASNGWHLVTYKSLPIGRIKKIGHRANNYFPKEIRVLK